MTDTVNKVLDQFGPLGLFVITIAFVGWSIITGRLVPKLFYEREVARADLNEAAAKISAQQVNTLLEKADMQTTLLKSIQEQAVRKGDRT